MYPYQNRGSMMVSVNGRLGGGGIMKAVVSLILFLLIAAFVVGILFSDSYWGNPPRERAEAERMQIENRGLEERQRIAIEAERERTAIETEAQRRAAERALMWKDRWNEVGIILAIVAVVGALAVAAIKLGGPVALQMSEGRAGIRAEVLEQKIALEEKVIERETKQAERMREERLLEQARLQTARFRRQHLAGNGRDNELHTTPPTSTSRTGGTRSN